EPAADAPQFGVWQIDRPARSGLEHCDRERRICVDELGARAQRRQRKPDRGTADERRRRQMSTERTCDQAGLYRTDALLAANRQGAELDELLPHCAPSLEPCGCRAVDARPFTIEQRVYGFAQPPLFVGQLEVHVLSWCSAR